MEPFTGAQRAFSVRGYYANNNSVILAWRMYRSHFGLRDISEAPSAKSIRKWITMFTATGSTVRIINDGSPEVSVDAKGYWPCYRIGKTKSATINSDEANFHVNGHVNKQNCRFWSETNPRLKHQNPLHSPKVVVWTAISARGILGPYFFENESGVAVTVRAESYCKMLREFLIPALREFQGHNSRTWFQQDGATISQH
ncbi:unnamed protein product [Euphydryas editha]|uniref:DUF4817 domain-containing protein n=1 Tax=Euphydryas editha TaxID=104508 RepID=A0AAU9U0D6_EUPED|nr:unnamed protein product [Euphydryas editha]CAH2092604.1 unnamed protein product [Euphydryas editha]